MPNVLRIFMLCVGVIVASVPSASAQTGFADFIDHVHLAVPDQPRAVDWYRRHFGGQPTSEGADRLMFGETRVIFQRNAGAQPSAGSAIDHLGFSVADLDAAMKALEADGAQVTTPARDVPGLFKLAFVEDPWGVRLEIVQDTARLGLHHVHLRAPDPGQALAWYASAFGGTVGKLKDRIDGGAYDGVWVLVAKGEATPSAGHAIDHLGFRPINVDAAVAALKTKNVTVTTEPRPLTLAGGASVRLAFVVSPDGARIELVQRTASGQAENVAPSSEVRALLAPARALRVGLYTGNPSSLLPSTPGQETGVGFELGRELARRLDVPFEPVVYPNNGAVLEGLRAGKVDVVFTNATAARAKEIDFTQPYLEVEAGFLVARQSALATIGEVDKSGVRVGVMEGSTTSTTLPAILKHASIVRVPTIEKVKEMLAGRTLDAFATNKSILFELSDALPGSKVLAGRYSVERLALGIPKGRDAGLPYVRSFVSAAVSNGLVKSAVERAGLRGAIVADSSH
jgi:polar amino acid transport system substrate-binding protein